MLESSAWTVCARLQESLQPSSEGSQEKEKLTFIEHKENIGGRFSVFSVVGLIPGAPNPNNAFGVAGMIAGYDKPLHESLGLPGFDSLGSGGLFS